jgi:hypothetical protein
MFTQGFIKIARAPVPYTMPTLHLPQSIGKATAAARGMAGRMTDADYKKRILHEGRDRLLGTVKPGGVDSAIARYNQKAISKAMGSPVPATNILGKTASGMAETLREGGQAALKGLKNPANVRKLHLGLEYGGLGALAGVDAHNAYKEHKEGDKAGMRKSLTNVGALGALAGATYYGSKVH